MKLCDYEDCTRDSDTALPRVTRPNGKPSHNGFVYFCNFHGASALLDKLSQEDVRALCHIHGGTD